MNTLTCVYCGMAYPEGTPPHGAQILTDHIRVCEKHPMRKLEADFTKVRNALIDLVGSSDPNELDGIETMIRSMPSGCNTEVTLNAIEAIRSTIPAP